MDIFDKVKTKKTADKVKKKSKKKEKVKKTEETNGTNPVVEPVVDDGWADEAGIDEVEIVVAKLKTNVQMTNLVDDKGTEDDGNKDDWANKEKKDNESEEDSTEKPETSPEKNTTTANNDVKPTEAAKPAGKFVPRHLRGGADSGPSLPSSSLINQGLRGPGGRFMRNKDPPKTESHAEFPTLGAAMKEISTKAPEGFEKVQNDVRGYRGGNDNAGNHNLSTSNKFGAFGS